MALPGLLARFLNGEVTLPDLEERIRCEDPKLHAWVEVRPEAVSVDGPLRGVPYGVKDIIEATGYRTTYGSPLYADHVSASDAGLVKLLRSRGAVMMGKTHTTSFAYYDPAPTRNPRNPRYTPGGSSSGSAAAVAAGMVPFAVGTQTQGSIIRPASYCGVVGFKPTYGLLPLDGVLPFAPTLDTAGFFTQNALDLRLLWSALGHAVDSELPAVYGMIEFPVQPEMQETYRHAIQTLSAFGCRIQRLTTPPSFELLGDVVRTINRYEGARAHRERYEQHGAAIGVKLAQLVREGLAIPDTAYNAAVAMLAQAKQDMAEVFAEYPVLVSAAAPGPPPRGLASTGDPRCNTPWTGLGVPAITIPVPVNEEMLPMGLQLAAGAHQDSLLISVACHCQALLNAAPPLDIRTED